MNPIVNLRALLVPVLTLTAQAIAQSGIPLTDSADGMTCDYYLVGSGLRWQRHGGDWIDADGSPYGEKAYAVKNIPVKAEPQRVDIDITLLAKRWEVGDEPVGALLLRSIPSEVSGIVNFSSRENPDPETHPYIVIEWDDGSVIQLGANADTYLPCSTVYSVGDRPIFKVGDGIAIVVFPFKARRDAGVRTARLVLTSNEQYGTASKIAVFRPMLPWMTKQPQPSGIAGGLTRDKGLEDRPEVIFVERFESTRWLRSWSDYDASGDVEVISSAPAERFEPLDGKALRVTIRKGRTQGLNMHYRFAAKGAGQEPEQVFLRYYLRFGESWDPILDGGKLPGMAGTYGRAGWGGRRSDGLNGWSARGSFYRMAADGTPINMLRGIGSFVAHADMSDNHGDAWGWNLGPSGMLEKNRWYSIEQQLKLNSPGMRDGVLRAWVDGQLVFEKTDIRFRDVPELRIESVWMNVYHGGSQSAHKDLTLFIDNLVVAREYIGPLSVDP